MAALPKVDGSTKMIWLVGGVLTAIGVLGLVGHATGAVRFPLAYRPINNFRDLISESARRHGIDPALIGAVMYQESRGNPRAVSTAGAIGLMQIMPRTGRAVCGLTREHLFDIRANIDCGARYLASIFRRTGDLRYTAAQYYGGPKARPDSRFGVPPVYRYVSEVMAHLRNIRAAM